MGSVNISSSTIGNTKPDPNWGIPFSLIFLSWGGSACKTCSLISFVIWGASSHVACINACPSFKSFTNSPHISESNSILISMLPQPYDFDSFEPMCENFLGKHISINPKFEDANIGIGTVIRERRKNFVKTWTNIYFIQPLNNGALMHIAPNNWALFKEKDNKYYFVKDFDSKPDNETIFINL